MKCEDIMNRSPEFLTERDTILRASKVMAETGVGFLPICDADKKVVGVVTDRDLVVRALALGFDARTAATAVMSTPPVTCLAQADLHDAEDLMERERKARLVMTNADGTIAGVLSITDIIEHAPKREALHTLQVLLLRESLGPRAGAAPDDLLLKDQPRPAPMPEKDLPHTAETAFTGGHRSGGGVKMFP